MTAHELAKALLAGPDLPVNINGWGSDEGLGGAYGFVVDGVNVHDDRAITLNQSDYCVDDDGKVVHRDSLYSVD